MELDEVEAVVKEISERLHLNLSALEIFLLSQEIISCVDVQYTKDYISISKQNILDLIDNGIILQNRKGDEIHLFYQE